MKWNIVTDSSCDLFPAISKDGQVMRSSVPFSISVGTKDYVDDARLDTAALVDAMEREKHASRTACPSPHDWLLQFDKADQIIAITISSQLSGSMNSAVIARDMLLERHPEKKIAILDSRSTGPELALCVEEIEQVIARGADFAQVAAHAEAFLAKTLVSFALSSFHNLVKNGRLSRLGGFLAHALGMWGIGTTSDIGEIIVKNKIKGANRAVQTLLDDMKARGYQGGKVAISHCLNSELAETLRSRIQSLWFGAEVEILPTRGLCSYYAERGGLIVSF